MKLLSIVPYLKCVYIGEYFWQKHLRFHTTNIPLILALAAFWRRNTFRNPPICVASPKVAKARSGGIIAAQNR